MRIVVINGSPKGKDSNTNVIVRSFLKGAQEAGAEAVNIFLAEKEIKPCMGCHTCWTRGPGQCIIVDSMPEVLTLMGGADIIVFASPVYFSNISGMLKTFMDRMTMIGSPHAQNNNDNNSSSSKNKNQQLKPPETNAPKLMMISSCGLPDRGEFDVTSLWLHKIARKMNMVLAGEIYAVQGKTFRFPPEKLSAEVLHFLRLAENAGREIASNTELSSATKKLLDQFPDIESGLA